MDENKPNPYILPASILIAAILIAGSVFYAFGRGGNGDSTGTKKYPKNAFTACLDSNKYASKVQADRTAAGSSVNGTPATFINGKFISGAQPWDVFKTAIEAGIKNPNAWPAQATDATSGASIKNAPPVSSEDVVLGDANAPVTIIEYGDYQCPFCSRFFVEIEPLIRDQYIKAGKARMVFRNYAFLGAESSAAGNAAECAKDQKKFWEYHDALYAAEHQDGRENNGNLNKDLFVKIAGDLKLTAK